MPITRALAFFVKLGFLKRREERSMQREGACCDPESRPCTATLNKLYAPKSWRVLSKVAQHPSSDRWAALEGQARMGLVWSVCDLAGSLV
jgi:hypothetical protein